ncbi:hypothetical protein [Blautia sp. MSJ-36]|uniref:hypothetical protein n=1 Tax=Blautia sp. MSJ-36 TaxID=2841530 RepID=UPI001C0F3FB5|nr:hypothetical protein [Blautia sp. MSJ-36]MBU5448560.1 hypothetical protein [Blautia sp. MSJ-36]
MIPFGLLSGFMDSKEIRITELGENGFRFRLAEECPEPERFLICFYDMKKAGYRKVEIRKFEMNAVARTSAAEEWCVQDQENGKKENRVSFFREYSVRVEQKDYMEEVQRLAGQYNRYIRLKLEGDDGELAKALTGYPAELDEVHCESLEEQKKLWFGENSSAIKRTPEADQSVEGLFWDRETEFALELNNTSLYEEYLRQPLKDFLASYWQKNYLTHSWLAGRTPERFYIGNQFCHNLFPTEEQLFSIMDKMRSEGLEITLAFSYIREFMLPSVGKLLEKVDNWCCIHGMNVEIVVNDWAVAEMLHGKTSHLCPVFGTLLNKRKKDPRMKYKSGDISLFQQNSLNAEFYRDFLAEEFHIHRYEWESCGYPQEFPPGKNSLHLPFYQTNTSQYCPLYALCTTGDRGTQQLAEHCPKFCEKYALLYPEHLHMMGRYNSLFGVDKTLLESPEMWKKIKGIKPDRIVVNL